MYFYFIIPSVSARAVALLLSHLSFASKCTRFKTEFISAYDDDDDDDFVDAKTVAAKASSCTFASSSSSSSAFPVIDAHSLTRFAISSTKQLPSSFSSSKSFPSSVVFQSSPFFSSSFVSSKAATTFSPSFFLLFLLLLLPYYALFSRCMSRAKVVVYVVFFFFSSNKSVVLFLWSFLFSLVFKKVLCCKAFYSYSQKYTPFFVCHLKPYKSLFLIKP